MYQVATRIWNEIASTQQMATRKWERLCRMAPEELDRALAAEEERLAADGVPARAIRAYLALAPLLDENRAVTRYVEGTASPSMRTFLPELTSPSELMTIAQEEYQLTPRDRAALARLIATRAR